MNLSEEDLVQQVGKLNKARKYTEVIQLLSNEILLEHNLARLYEEQGDAYYGLSEYSQAIDAFKTALKINPKSAYTCNAMGMAYSEILDSKMAINLYKKAIKIDSKYKYAYYNLGIEYYNLDLYSNAIDSYNQAIQIDNKYDNAFYNRAITYEIMENYEKALTDFKTYISLTEKTPDSYTALAKSRVEKITKLLRSPTFTAISEIVTKIKKSLLYNQRTVTHYTGFSVAKFLIINKKKFRISEGTYLNDTSEGRELFDFLPALFKDVSKDKSTVAKPFATKPFIGSFVADHKYDDLTLWRMYGKEENIEAKGCAITIDRESFIDVVKKVLTSSEANGKTNKINEEFNFYRVAYRTVDDKRPLLSLVLMLKKIYSTRTCKSYR